VFAGLDELGVQFGYEGVVVVGFEEQLGFGVHVTERPVHVSHL
jgi:hypothetical protein